jgi:hypothetical protein
VKGVEENGEGIAGGIEGEKLDGGFEVEEEV